MQDLLQAAFEPVNLLYTLSLLFVLLYWLSVILGAIDLSAFDFDLDVDADFDMEADIDMDADVDAEADTGTGGWLAGVLHFFNFGKLPFMLIMTVVILSGWIMTIISNHYLGDYRFGFMLALFIPILFVSLLIAKIITTPLLPVFARLNRNAEPVNYIGHTCKLRLPASASKFGQAEVIIDDAPLLVNVKTTSDELSLQRGELARIIGKTADGKYFLVERVAALSDF